ncbi:MAG: alpha/beta hydrolase-fold protein [Planctomycetota bacterium]|nr:alpha/beta hydrolase-fold protein [Planctomycetota bacterium]
MDAITNQGFGSLGLLSGFPVTWRISNTVSNTVSKVANNIVVAGLLALVTCGADPCAFASDPNATHPVASRAASPSRKIRHVLFYDGQAREFSVYLPPACNSDEQAAALPVVFAFHGVMMNGETMAKMTLLHELGNRCNFIVVYPDGDGHGILRTWNSGGRSGRLERIAEDDVGFVRCVVAQLQKQYRIDPKRIHATGFSNGAMLCYRLAVEAPEVFASIAPIAGTLAVPVRGALRFVPTLHIHGTEDKVVAWDGPNRKTPKNLDFMSVPQTLDAWKNLLTASNNESESPKLVCRAEKWPDRKADGTRIEVQRYAIDPDSDVPDLQFVRVIGGGHTWPGGENREWVVGKTSEEFNANEMMWDFFQNHPLP